MKNSLLAVALGFAVIAAPVYGAETKDTTTKDNATGKGAAKKADKEKKSAKGQENQVTKLAEKFNVPAAEVTALRDKGYGWGEVGHALAIAEKSGKPLSEITALRDSGLGWGQIAQKYGFKLGAIHARAGEIEREGEKAEKSDKRVKGEGAGKNKKDTTDTNQGAHAPVAGPDHNTAPKHEHGAGHGNPGGGKK